MSARRRFFGVLAVVVLVAVGFFGGWFVGRTALGEAMDPSTLPVVEQAFINQMNGAAMVGHFTIHGRDNRQTTPDRYDIYSVEKVADDRWRFNAKIGETGVTVPVVVRMTFAEDTPVILLDGLSIPGMGMFSGRVVFHGDQYIGTWEHLGKGGGLMYGRIERGAAKQ
jgi:hypothetical protein